jgi:hypothetical protein
MMKFHHIFYLLFFVTYILPVKAEYLVFLTGLESQILPIDEQEYEKIHSLLAKYAWPMSIAHANEIDFEAKDSISPINEEEFLRKKLREINLKLDIAFVPTILYELFCVAHANTIDELNITSPIVSAASLDNRIHKLITQSSQSVKQVLEIYDIVNSKYPDVRRARQAVNNAFILHLQNLLTDPDIKFNRDIKETHVSDIIKELCFTIKNKLFEKIEFTMANQSGTALYKLKELLNPLNIRHDNRQAAENPQKDFFARIVKLEYDARDQFAGILYRALGPMITYIPKERATVPIIDSILNQDYDKDEYTKLLKSYENSTDIVSLLQMIKFRTVSYGNSLFAGFYFDPGACVLKYLSGNTIGYSLFIDKRGYLKEIAAQMSGKSTNAINAGNIFRISPFNTIVGLFAQGEFFHSRSLLYSSARHPLSWIVGIALDVKDDKTGFIVKKANPLPYAAFFSRIVGDSNVCHILKLNSQSTSWGNQFDLSSAMQQKIIEGLFKGQQQYTQILQSLVSFEKFYRELLDKYPQLQPPDWNPSQEERTQLRKAMQELMQRLK